jgi:hypothetical protein
MEVSMKIPGLNVTNHHAGLNVNNLYKSLLFIISIIMLVACANTGIVPMDKGTYLIAKKSPQVGFGPPIGIKGEAYKEANEFCAKSGKAVETLKYDETNSGFARAAAISLEFRCISR